ncbi:hypothetical protein [Kribbella sp.]|uniref:hypothetical protein n=1 Tax=Kribbella sp. TaxID=1871183 RepID=UPI002D4B9170|nr:hypothetical protein [Kribbella sp.]HZX01761.1 hypothetical protein [Kribbella sp.]
MTVGGVDTYYDYEDKQWKSRKLGGGPIHHGPVCPAPQAADHPVRDTTPHDRRPSGHQVVPKHTLN